MTHARDLARLVPLPSDPSKRYAWSPEAGWSEIADAAPVSSVVAKTAAAQTSLLSDAGQYLRFTNASASTYTVAPQSSVAWPDNAEITIRRAAAGNLTLTPGSGVTLNAPSGGTLTLTNAMTVTIKRVDSNVWDVIGQTVAA